MPRISTATEANAALRNVGWVMAQRGLQIGIGVLFAVLVPRLMGPEVFGRYALVTSVSLWFALLSGLGAVSIMTRSVPGFVARGDMTGLQKLVSGLLALRIGTGFAAGVAYLALTMLWLRDIDVIALALMAGAVLTRTAGNLCFTLFLGLNQAGRWGLGELLRRTLTLAFVLLGFSFSGLRGACAGWFAANVVVLAAGLWMGRAHVRWSLMWPDRLFLAPFLRTGAYFAGGNLLLAISQRTGETLVKLTTNDFAEVGYFGVAYGIYAAGTLALWHVAVAFAPLLVFWNEQGDYESSGAWLERLLAWLTVAAMTCVIVVIFVGERAVAWLLGHEYLPAAPGLLPLAIGVVAVAISSVGRLQALVADHPGIAATAAGIELVGFWTTGVWLTSSYGSLGACVAVLAGATLNAAYLVWRLRGERPYSHRASVKAALLALPVLPLAWFGSSGATQLVLLGVALAIYSSVLFGTRVIALNQLTTFRRSLGARPTTAPNRSVDEV